MGVYVPGEDVRLSATFEVDDVLTNPGAVLLRLHKPHLAEVVLTSASSPAITNPSTGLFRVVIPADLEGVWRYRWEGTAPAKGAKEGEFSVRTLLET